jgi:hypothetical protein
MQEFTNMEAAFDYCRDKDRPVVVSVEGIDWKLYPSGRADRLEPTDDLTEIVEHHEQVAHSRSWPKDRQDYEELRGI